MQKIYHYIPTLIVLIVSLAVTYLAWQHERDIARRDLQSTLDFQLRQTTSRIEQRMAAYEEMLRGVQGLFTASGEVGPAAFTRYIDALKLGADFSGVMGIGLTPIVLPAELDSFTARMRVEGHPDFHVWPDGNRDMYAPFAQIEPPFGRNLRALGFDPLFDHTRRIAMEQARDSGNAVLSGKIKLAIDDDATDKPGFLMILPIYKAGRPHDTQVDRQTAISGWVISIFRMSDLMASLYGEGTDGLVTEIFDGITPSEKNLLFLGASTDGGPAHYTASEVIVVSGHSWTVEIHATTSFEERFSKDKSDLILLAGTVFGLLLTVISWQMATARARAVAIAETMTSELKESEACWKFALEGAGDGVWDWHVLTGELRYSEHWKAILGPAGGADNDGMQGWISHIHPDDLAAERACFEACLAGKTPLYHHDHRIRWTDGTWHWMTVRGMVVAWDADGTPLRMIGTVSDISERRESEERIRHLAQHDPLTNLPNRALFSDRLQTALALAKRNGEQVALMFVDLDRFKPINDRFGHAVGDLLLKEVAKRMRHCVRDSDTVARIGGDEFVVLLPAVGSAVDAALVAEKIRAALARDFFLADQHMDISSSIGVALFPQDGHDAITLSKNADDAMYRAKQCGRNRVQLVRERTDPGPSDTTSP
ncbi:diguanylate cyclase domain-containing protein [Telmatospirillum sp.]|uniref:diguanylate cyclase domain-containing protein n=1 Tax=Telmatospirillum sp. TaxID=2079197 RepID=UPI002849EE50|nr:diguanylate cyclase [Telmatospirillum sp.]MDR3440548.1 diguanylate cyclase [Telmatospirillum sp.]